MTEPPSHHRTSRGSDLVMMRCPAPPELLLYASQLPDDREPRDTAHHVSQCASCQATVTGIRDVASRLQSLGADAAATENCLDDMTVAVVVEQRVDTAERPELIAHLAACARCREQVASVAGLLRDTSVAAEIGRLEVSTAGRFTRRWRVAGAGVATALAAALAFMVVGSSDRVGVTQPLVGVTDTERHRSQSVTTTVAPNLLAPVGAVAAADTFRWTSVPRADRYRLTLFDREGTVVWEVAGSDTAMAPPVSFAGKRGTAYLWKVEARTGRDRWVASELIEFSVTPTGRNP